MRKRGRAGFARTYNDCWNDGGANPVLLRSLDQRAPRAFQVFLHQTPGGLGIARTDGVDDGAVLAAMDDGLDNNLDPGQPEERNIYEAMAQGKEVKKLPMSLGEALDHPANNEVVKRGMPGEMYRL